MNKLMICVLVFSAIGASAKAQNYIAEAQVEYEVKTNIKKTMGSGFWADLMKENMQQFKTAYYSYTFHNNEAVFKFDRWTPNNKLPQFMKNDDEENIWYSNFNTGAFSMKKTIQGLEFVVTDSLRKINWKLTNENMMIAGFNCRKAEAIIFDSVYIFAFYSEELMIPGGPCSINGLPGLVLGLTIPRLYTSYIATKINVTDVPKKELKPLSGKNNFTYQSLYTTFYDRMKDWYSDEQEGKKYLHMELWKMEL